MFRFATVATIATMAVAQTSTVGPSAEMIKKMLGPKCTMSAEMTAALEAMEKGEASPWTEEQKDAAKEA